MSAYLQDANSYAYHSCSEKSSTQTEVSYRLMFEQLSSVNLISPPSGSDMQDSVAYTILQVLESLAPSYVSDYVDGSSTTQQGNITVMYMYIQHMKDRISLTTPLK